MHKTLDFFRSPFLLESKHAAKTLHYASDRSSVNMLIWEAAALAVFGLALNLQTLQAIAWLRPKGAGPSF